MDKALDGIAKGPAWSTFAKVLGFKNCSRGDLPSLVAERLDNQYYSFTMDLVPKEVKDLHALVDAMDKKYGGLEYMRHDVKRIENKIKLVLLGKKGTGTTTHLDFSGAATIAFAANIADMDKVLATWLAVLASKAATDAFNTQINQRSEPGKP